MNNKNILSLHWQLYTLVSTLNYIISSTGGGEEKGGGEGGWGKVGKCLSY